MITLTLLKSIAPYFITAIATFELGYLIGFYRGGMFAVKYMKEKLDEN